MTYGFTQDLPDLPPSKTPTDSVQNALSFFSQLQLPPGNWACEYGGPMFLLPGLVCTWYATQTPIPKPVALEMKRYLFARQNPDDGGWGLHVEGQSTAYGTIMTYVVLRLLGAGEEDKRLIKARGMLHQLGGAVNGPHWAKVWLAVLGVMEWDAVNPVPPELWYAMRQKRAMYSNRADVNLQARPRLGTICSLAVVDSYASSLSPDVIYILYEIRCPIKSPDSANTRRALYPIVLVYKLRLTSQQHFPTR